jgi:P2-related tail formation protein
MSDQVNILPDSVSVQPQFLSFELLMQQRFRRISLDKILFYFIETVRVELLPVLAEEFDVLGVKGWDFTTTEQEQRDLLKRAIILKRYRGTRWAIEEALKVTPFSIYNFQERTGGHWAKFRISISINDYAIDVQQLDLAAALVNEYKRASSVFDGIWVTDVDYADTVTASETLAVGVNHNLGNDSIATTGQFLADGTVLADASRNAQNETDCIIINIV